MDLIAKVTEKCNFACKFCSSTSIGKKDLSVEDIAKVLAVYDGDVSNIIMNGGDPLLVSPDLYWKLIDFIEKNDYDTRISITSNLWDFFWKPEKWTALFKHPRVGVITSFQYGDGRRLGSGVLFTEDLFRGVSDLFLDRVGYRPDFISVIDHNNSALAIRNVELAKELDVECKLNYAMITGRQKTVFPVGEISYIYSEIYNKDLHPWEYNTKQFLKVLKNEPTTCPILPNCDSSIRCLQPNGYFTCGSFGDDNLYSIRLSDDINKKQTPLRKDPNLICLKEECLTCDCYKVCHGCKKHIHDLKECGDRLINLNCTFMKNAYARFIELINEKKSS